MAWHGMAWDGMGSIAAATATLIPTSTAICIDSDMQWQRPALTVLGWQAFPAERSAIEDAPMPLISQTAIADGDIIKAISVGDSRLRYQGQGSIFNEERERGKERGIVEREICLILAVPTPSV